jgi:hypothetical protein
MIQGGGIEIVLEDMMVDYVRQWTANVGLKVKLTKKDPSYPGEGEGEVQGPPTVHAGMLPKTQVGLIDVNTIPIFPFILCHITQGVDVLDIHDMTSSRVNAKVIAGVWDDNVDWQGYRDAMGLVRRVVRKLWREDTLGESYQLDKSEGISWRIYDTNEVSWPFFLAEATVCWQIRRPVADYESEDLDVAVDPAFARQPIIPAGIPELSPLIIKPLNK